ncbi:hypothetical protein H0I76_15305 [Limibaculum sp. M0105]|uniref:Uncharacterized protein n=1 Tax=Thermohalobaculum xanthum TaxID=2753746 RepID=A0A8J7SIV5_9RHOB|nr:hypothetical protein [Thermohalobaculum xanthum]MBK0400565.1 hypothetical protein [Thermohalobaculum xanthum]
MAPRWRYLRARLAAACAVFIGATSVHAAEARFDYTVERVRGVANVGSTSTELVDPELCGDVVGWIETVTSQIEARADVRRLPWQNPIRVRKGIILENFHETPKRYGTSIGKVVGRIPAIMMVEYRGCVVPSGKVLLSLKAHVTVDADDGPQRFVVTYDGPPMPIEPPAYKIDPANFRVETDLGDPVVSHVSLPSSVSFSADLHQEFQITLRLQNQGATQ